MSRAAIKSAFPRLKNATFFMTSPATPAYNCIAWAAEDSVRYWWPAPPPHAYWPPRVKRELTLAAFIAAFETLGYANCDSAGLEKGFDKIALFVGADGKPTHAARQLKTGLWTSKLGLAEDISHSLYALEGGTYGSIAQVMRRTIPATAK